MAQNRLIDALRDISDIAYDYDGCKSAPKLKELIDELREIAQKALADTSGIVDFVKIRELAESECFGGMEVWGVNYSYWGPTTENTKFVVTFGLKKATVILGQGFGDTAEEAIANAVKAVYERGYC